MGVGDLAHILRDLDLRLDGAVLVLDGSQLIHATKHRLRPGRDQSLTHTEHIDFGALAKQILNDILVQRVGNGDLTFGPSGLVQHLSCLLAQVCHITGIQTDAALFDPQRLQHFVEYLDRIGYTGLQGVVGIHQQGGIIGVHLTIGFECFIFGIEHLHPGMGHSAACINTEQLIGDGAGRAVTATDIGGSCAQNGCVCALRPTGTEFQHRSSLCCPNHTVGLGCDQTLVIDGKQQEGFDQLRLNGRRPDRDNGFFREYRSSLRYGPNITGKLEVCQIFQKIFAEELSAPEVFDILRLKTQFLNVFDHLLQTGCNGKAATVGTATVKQIKVSDPILITMLKITVSHGQLVKISEHRQIDLVVHFQEKHLFR